MVFCENKLALRQLNPFLELNINHLCTICFDYHNTNVFPVNILALVHKDDGKGGNYYFNLEGKQRMPMLADHVYFLPCDLKIRFDITQGVTLTAMHFNLTFFNGVDIFSGSKNCMMHHDPNLVAKFRAILEEKDDVKAICELKAEVMRLCASCWPEGKKQALPTARKYEPLFRYVRDHGDAKLKVDELAKQAGLCQHVFSRNFRRDIGKSPKEFLQDDLLKKMSTLLLLPQTSVKQVACELKFSSEFYMSRFFKKRTGMSPSEYQAKFRR